MDEKKCSKCGETKPLDEFHRDKSKRDGRRSHCATCMKGTEAARRDWKLQYNATYKVTNRHEIAARKADYYFRNPHVNWVGCYRFRCRQIGMLPVVEHFTKADVIVRYGDSCFYCETGAFEHLDHATPVIKGGPHTLDNARPSCASCNLAKHNATEAEWLAEQVFLDGLAKEEVESAIDAEIERWAE